MTVTEAEKQQILAEAEAKRKRELSEKMRRLGQIRSAKKRKSSRKNIQIAKATFLNRQLGLAKPKGKP